MNTSAFKRAVREHGYEPRCYMGRYGSFTGNEVVAVEFRQNKPDRDVVVNDLITKCWEVFMDHSQDWEEINHQMDDVYFAMQCATLEKLGNGWVLVFSAIKWNS